MINPVDVAAIAVMGTGDDACSAFDAYLEATAEVRQKVRNAFSYDEREWEAFKAAWALRGLADSAVMEVKGSTVTSEEAHAE